jgi:rhamnogalacturonyl hydrolase YesR
MFRMNKKPAAKSDEALAKIDRAIADALASGISAGSLRDRLERAAQGLQWAAHNESERRRVTADNAVAVNEAWFQREKARLIKAGEWPH